MYQRSLRPLSVTLFRLSPPVLLAGLLVGGCSGSPGRAGTTSNGGSAGGLAGAAGTGGSIDTTGGGGGGGTTPDSGTSSGGGGGAGTGAGAIDANDGSDAGLTDATAESAPEPGLGSMSSGCGMALPPNVKLGQWTDMADPGNGNPPPIKAGNVNRGYWVRVPPSYDKTKPYKVIYQGAGCGVSYPNGSGKANLSGTGNGFQALWDFQSVDMGQAIQVGIDYGYNPARPNCFDDQNTQSNDFTFFPILKTLIEGTFCVDPSHIYISGHSSGSWMANQMTCAFGNQIRGIAVASGNEPPLPTCAPGAHFAGLFLHDVNDRQNTYKGILPACARALKNNGCATTTCNPSDATTSTPWPTPAGLTLPGNGKCVQFNGCRADSPVVFCTTTNADPTGEDHYERVNSFIAPLFWHLFKQF